MQRHSHTYNAEMDSELIEGRMDPSGIVRQLNFF